METAPAPGFSRLAALALFLLLPFAGCSDDDTFVVDDDGGDLTAADDLPGVVVTITEILGLEGRNTSFQVGDRITVEFTVAQDDDTPIPLEELSRGAILVSGPTFNYQRVIPSQSDLLERAEQIGDGKYRYRFALPIPSTYMAPYNDTDSFTEDDGELTGEALLAGTYTVGIELRKDYEIDGASFRDPGNATADFLFGGATVIESREIVTRANCMQCHGDLRAHGDNRTEITNCLLCHTAGSEDRNNPDAAGGTPGASIDFKVMIHKIHAGKHLPSVLGVTTNPDGSRKYDAVKQPYQLVGFGDTVHDYSEVGYPKWPTLAASMPADTGYGTLSSEDQALEDATRSAPVDCASCHGDPDGVGPLPAPTDGDLIYVQPTRVSCASCHDDWIPEHPYTSNMQTMPPQLDDADCKLCHKISGGSLDVVDAHRHPLVDPGFATGVHFDLLEVAESGTNDSDETIDPGEKIRIRFTIQDDAGNDIDPATLSRFEGVVTGPTTSPNLLLFTELPTSVLASGGTHQINLPERLYFELVGSSVGGLQSFGTARTPHWSEPTTATAVYLRTTIGAGGNLAVAADAYQNFVDLMPGEGASFTRDAFVVIDDAVPGQEEYLQVQFVDGDRLWFSSPTEPDYAPAMRFAHGIGAAVSVVGLDQKPSADYTLDAPSGVITEVNEFGNGKVLVSYTTDFVVPSVYRGTLNDSPDLEQDAAEWRGLAVLDGTYTVGIWASRTFDFDAFGEITTYREAAPPDTIDFRFGSASAIQPNLRIDSADTCNACHTEIQFHGGGRRGYGNCLLCHGIAGAEDRPPYVAGNAPATLGVSIDFRNMLHKIHHGKELASDYTVVGFGTGYPDNFSLHTYEGVGFPAMPGGSKDCAACHGADNDAWHEPAARVHPDATRASQVWAMSCGACHDDSSAQAHIAANTGPDGSESCAICHGEDGDYPVEIAHKVR